MKKSLLILSFLSGISLTYSQNVNIPDANFKAYLVGNTAINTNADTEIQVSEANAFTGTITCNSLNISDMTGIEAFTSLQELYLYYNNFTSIDLSQNTALTILHIYINQLNSLDVSNNTALTELRCERNPIMSLNVSSLTNLETLTCGNNGLSSLDVTNNINLKLLDIGGNPAYGNANQITSLNLNNNTQLNHLGTTSTPITALNLSNNTGLTVLECPANNLTSLDISMLPNLGYLNCSSNSITSLNVNNNLALTTLNFGLNPITGSFNLSNHSSLNSISCFETEISSLNIANGNNTNFTRMWAYSNPNLNCIQVDDATWSTTNWNAWNNIDNHASFSENCSSCIVNIPDANFKAYLVGNTLINTNSNSEIECSEAANFTGEINCSNLNINVLTGIEAFINLTSLKCQGNNLTSLDVSTNNELQLLHCYVNSINSLNLGTNNNLYYVDCANNQLNSLDISANTNLWSLNCSYNQLSTLDITTSSTFSELYCRNNQLTSLFLANGNNTNWTIFTVINNPNLSCIEVDDATWSTTNWTNIDAAANFSENCSGGLGIDNLNDNSLNIYPNPVTSILNVESTNKVESITILDLQGNIIDQSTSSIYSTEHLNAGVYFINVKTENGIIKSKFIKK